MVRPKNWVNTTRMTRRLEKRRKNTPRHAQHGAFVFFLEVPLDELFEEEFIF